MLNYDFMFTSIFNREENVDILEEFISFYFNIELKEVRERYSIRNEEGEELSDLLLIDVIDMELGSELWYTEPTNKMYGWSKLFLSKNEAELEESRKYIMGREIGEKLDWEVKKLSRDDEMVYLYTKLSREKLEKNTLIEEAKEAASELKEIEQIIE